MDSPRTILPIAVLAALLIVPAGLLTAQTGSPRPLEAWVTNADRSSLFQKVTQPMVFRDTSPRGAAIVIDPGQQMQPIDGFGFALTGGSAELLAKMTSEARAKTLRQLFAADGNSAGVSYLRLTIGASDMTSFVYSYDDLKAGETDPGLAKFNLGEDRHYVLPVLKEILAIAPAIKILGSPWSAPAWMKTNGDVRGGTLKEEFYPAYALYLVRYIQEMKKEGVAIDAISIQNEPLNSKNTPSMQWQVNQQLVFLRDHLYPAFRKAALTTKVILFDHNLDRPDYPLALLSDPIVSHFADGTGFHHYGGDMGAMSQVHTARPDKNLYLTEQMVTEQPGSPRIAIAGQVKRMIVDTMRNWSRNVILWNLAADPKNGPHTNNGGCPVCQGAITIDGDAVSMNLAYYTIAHASRFVRPGSVRIGSTARGDQAVGLTEDEERPGVSRMAVIEHSPVLPNVAFRTPEGKFVLIVANDRDAVESFAVQYGGQVANVRLAPGSVGTYVW
ncbi:MAG TPA: glycoside hydrolase family 30 beta sandwich domain-containing protein [Bryobacteraceae bacterium]|jgi:glucosylceramidase|nr:glycoside hydrolase family 30 beta sandwich domain-containing protein [Bryobacteraceae bacterium]